MKKRNYKPHSKPSKTSEPEISYNQGKKMNMELRVFHSFEEMNEYDLREMASFTPEERVQHITENIMYLYAKELAKPMNLNIKLKDGNEDDVA